MENPEARSLALGYFIHEDVIIALTHIPPGLRESLLPNYNSSPESYDVARQSLRASGFGDVVKEHHEFFSNTARRVLKT
eukprot:11079385-Prorocentrum_lima.AAC.1